MEPEQQSSSKPGKPGALQGLLFGGLIGAAVAGLALAIGPFIGSELGHNRLVLKIAEANEVKTPWDLLAFPFLMLIVLGTHEIGHLIGGLSQGMRFLLLIVGPFGWHASVSGPRFEWNTNVALMGGLAATLPTEVGSSLRRQLLVMIAGGPLASLLLAIFAVAAIAYVEPRLAAYCLIVAVTSFGIFLVTLIPVRAGGFMSDGMQLIDVWRGGTAVVERSALLRVFAQSMDGVRPRDWDAKVLEGLSKADSEDPTRRTGGLLYSLMWAMDGRRDADIAHYRALLEGGVDGYPPGFRQSVHVELAISAWLAGETDAVRRHLAAGKGGVVEQSRRLLAQAALARLEGREEDCQRDRLLALKALAKASDAGQKKLTEDQLAKLAPLA